MFFYNHSRIINLGTQTAYKSNLYKIERTVPSKKTRHLQWEGKADSILYHTLLLVGLVFDVIYPESIGKSASLLLGIEIWDTGGLVDRNWSELSFLIGQ